MALARLALKNLSQRIPSSSSSSLMGLHRSLGEGSLVQRQKFGDEFLRRFMATTASGDHDKATTDDKKSEGKEVAVKKVGKKLSKLFPWRKGGRKGGLWRRNENRDFVPVPSTLNEIFPSGLGNALMEATDNINRLFDDVNIAPNQLMARVKEQDDCYKVRYAVPGLAKEDVKITINNGVLTIKGEHKEEEEEDSDDEYWSASSYGYYNTSLVLPDDAKVDDIKAEMKDGVLTVIILRTEKPKVDVKEVEIH
ncbi:26.5 kDa heat shock mitochondrial -like protein [Tripterygium wilfordii]|uniref:26.5 kDa heat shock mitochondrial -like protein n=1 Tax=Tripterygium wilfordii TaxID=458696 RepID=A0A7J7BZ74_TRIWF|nr:26.5 kDa heat shock protein, mitochondrial-like [Tripterygium wilfordii]KAF5726927.1 26.5 kDa heat shock mitochondrial -like protein [Tripterygium wilfordii]